MCEFTAQVAVLQQDGGRDHRLEHRELGPDAGAWAAAEREIGVRVACLFAWRRNPAALVAATAAA